MFGGARLYGDNCEAAIRELIQNAADAICARRKLDPDFVNGVDGEIVVRLAERDGGFYLEVEDNGVGMSERTITGTLLDFGRSFWATEDVKSEFPGLMAKGMSPTGKFGIGFFSVFMLGDVVRVTSRRYESGSTET
jgi:HSP90 family molecular chaperone